MKNQSHLVTLNDLAQKAITQANKQLGNVRQLQQQAEQQLALLLTYQDEYQLRLNATMTSGMTSASWQNYQQFIQTLEHAIDKHKQQLRQCTQRVEQAITYWQEKQQRLNAYETLQERAESTQRRHKNRLDQKVMDEFAQRGLQRSLLK